MSDRALEGLLHQSASDVNKPKRQLSTTVRVIAWKPGDCLTGDKLLRDILWLSPPNPRENHNTTLDSRHRKTREPFNDNILSDLGVWTKFPFRSGRRRELFFGTLIPSILSSRELTTSASSTITEVMQNYVLPALAMYFRENQKKGFRRFFSSVPGQLCRQSDSYSGILSDLHSEHDDAFDGFDDPGDDAVVRCLKRLL